MFLMTQILCGHITCANALKCLLWIQQRNRLLLYELLLRSHWLALYHRIERVLGASEPMSVFVDTGLIGKTSLAETLTQKRAHFARIAHQQYAFKTYRNSYNTLYMHQ